MDLESIASCLREAGRKLKANKLKAAHEVLEPVRTTLMEARQRHDVDYYLDGMTRFHDTMESIVKPSIAARKKGERLSEDRREDFLKLIAQARQQWQAVEAQELDPRRFGFNKERLGRLRANIRDEFAALERAEAAARTGDDTAALQAMKAIKPPFAKAFMLFGDFPGGKAPSPGDKPVVAGTDIPPPDRQKTCVRHRPEQMSTRRFGTEADETTCGVDAFSD